MTRKRKCHSKSNSFVAAAEEVCLQPVRVRAAGRRSCILLCNDGYHFSMLLRFDTRSYFNMRSKADISQINLSRRSNN